MKIYGADQVTPGGVLPLSSAVEAQGLIFFSGQLAPRDPKAAGDIEAQTHLVFDQLEQKLADAGLSLDNVVKATVWLTDPAHFAGFNAVYGKRFSAPYPARSCVVSALVLPDALLEIEILAARTPRSA